MHAYLFLFLCHHGEYLHGFLHTTNLFTWGFRIYDALDKYFYFFYNVMLKQKSKYAKNDYAEKINMDNYRFYLPARVQCFKSSKKDFSPCLFLRWLIWPQGGDHDMCTPWYGVTHVLRSSSSHLKWSINCEN
jgi:hypothetical protein